MLQSYHNPSLFTFIALLSLLVGLLGVNAAVIPQDDVNQRNQSRNQTCERTKVAILGAGIAGITIAQALSNHSITDFLILEYKDHIGGRVHSEPFGINSDGKPFVVEYGANWIQGLGGRSGKRENPIWTFEQKWNIKNHPSNYTNILTYNETGPVDFTGEIDAFGSALEEMEERAGEILADNQQDSTVRAGFSLVGWKPSQREYPAASEAVEWWLYDGEQAATPEESSLVFNAAVSNFTFLQFSDENNFVIDQRGHRAWIQGEASTFLSPQDKRLRLNTIVKSLEYSADGVVVTADDGSCVQADYAVCTFSLGVLQRENAIDFQPALPSWKKTAIEMFEIGVYTKIFMQFPYKWWKSDGNDPEYFLYADPYERGWYPIWQSLDVEGFFPGSHILFVTLTGDQAYRAERMTDEETCEEAMSVLRLMFPDIDIPQPVAFQYPRWSSIPWAYGSFSVWPAGTTLEMHENLRANVDRLWFTGEHTSASYFGYMQGAWFEGRDAGNRIAGLIRGACEGEPEECGERISYPDLDGTTTPDEYDEENGWDKEGYCNTTESTICTL
ncbi:putative flavin-containing polyamine oxidase [Xylaria sp. FL0064]|nr:putative flavin-containing polyamine oxidase [Xylaria sp. FL0064]